MSNYSVDASLRATVSKYKRAIQSAKKVTEKFKRESDSVKDTKVEADTKSFRSSMDKAKDLIKKFKEQKATADADANISPLKRNIKKAKQMLNMFAREKAEAEVQVGADTSEAKRKMGLLQAVKKAISQKVVIPVEARVDRFQKTINRIANFIQSFGIVAGNVFKGVGIAASSGLVPIIASLTGAVGGLGVQIGNIAGGLMGLVSSIGAAGFATGGFLAVAIPTISKIAKMSKEIEKGSSQWNQLSSSTQEAITLYRNLGKQYRELQILISEEVNIAFIEAMKLASQAMKTFTPLIQSTAEAVVTLMKDLNNAMKAPDMKTFAEWLNGRGSESFSAWARIIGYAIRGVLNLMVAFDPLAKSMESGILSMTKGFSEWAVSLKESERFNSFIEYVKTNGPKLLSVIGNITVGLVELFAGFGPMASDMMTKLQEMAKRFRTWATTISENKGFQDFISYIQENGPKVISLIGNVITFIKNLGVALAPMGSRVLDVANAIFSWTNSMMENHPIIGKIIAVITVLAGALITLVPTIAAWQAAFGGAAKAIWVATGMMRAKFITGIAMMVKSMGRFIAQMAVMVAKFVAKSVMFIARWTLMGVKATLSGAKIAAAWILATGKDMAVALAKLIATSAKFIARWVLMGAKAMLQAAKVASAWVLATGKAMATAIAQMVATSARFVARWALMGAKALLHAAKVAASWFIALGPVGWVIATVIGLVVLIIANWEKVSSVTKKVWNAVWTWIKETWEKVWNKTKEIASNLAITVNEKFQQIVNSVREKMSAAKKWVQDKWQEAKSATVSKLKELVSSVTKFFREVVSEVESKLSDAVSAVGEFIGKMPGKVLEFVGEMVDAGADLVGGVISGIKSKISEGLGVIGGLASDLISRFKRDTETKSPSRAFAKISKWFPAGIAKGINDKKRVALKAVNSMANNLTDTFRPDLQVESSRITSSLKGLKRKSSAKVESAVNADVEFRTKQPANIQFIIGRNSYRAFVEDITDEQELQRELENQFF